MKESSWHKKYQCFCRMGTIFISKKYAIENKLKRVIEVTGALWHTKESLK